jgi:hypothetical protein
MPLHRRKAFLAAFQIGQFGRNYPGSGLRPKGERHIIVVVVVIRQLAFWWSKRNIDCQG